MTQSSDRSHGARSPAGAAYELFYWPSIQGRGEFVRLALEDAGVPYADVARHPAQGGMKALKALLAGESGDGPAPFAPPFLRAEGKVIAQTANILFFLAPRIARAGGEWERLHAHQLQLSIMDWVAEVHDTHHPVSSALFYEDQKKEAKERSLAFWKERVPKFLTYFERVIEGVGGEHVLSSGHSYVDLSLFQMVEGMRYAFPRAMRAAETSAPRLLELHRRVSERPLLRDYLDSERRIPFNENGIFRHYAELDGG